LQEFVSLILSSPKLDTFAKGIKENGYS